ncbi:MAG TPA: imidazolonepropionase [Lentimicrobium sp.]|nr:imidazolonepropionase [Lentimicrobium sp.]
MPDHLILKNIDTLAGIVNSEQLLKSGGEMAEFESIHNAWLEIKDGLISDFGIGEPLKESLTADYYLIDCKGGSVFPSFCDSHTHLVYAGSREIEYIDKIKGLSYEEIAKRGGGILNSAARLHNSSEDQLFTDALERINEILEWGTGAVEIKSGYGLNTEDELKMLRVIRRLKETSSLVIKSTFLGAHAVPSEYKGRQGAYVDLVVNEMIPKVAEERLADFIDVFCDKGFFTVDETERMLEAGINYGLKPKIHANELDYSGGIQAGVRYHALSTDHLEYTGDEEIEALKGSGTMATVLPGAAFFLNMVHAPVRKMINSGLPIALASDFNPGSSPSGNMQLILSMGCIMFRMTPQEAFNASTLNGAYAMGISDMAGSITHGKIANLYITKPIPSIEYMPYYYGFNKIEHVILKGKLIEKIAQ